MGNRLRQRGLQGQLQETTDVNLPQSPAAAESAGLPADSAKMSGTGAQKRRPIRDLQQQRQQQRPADLATRQRTAQPRKQRTTAEEEARFKAEQLQQLGSLGTKVQSMIENKLRMKDDVQAQARIEPDMLDTVPTEQQAQAKQLLDAYALDRENLDKLAAVNNFFQANELGDFDPNSWLRTDQEMVGETVAEELQDEILLADLQDEMAPDELAALEENFGENWKDMTLPEMEAAMQAIEQEEFSRVQGLQAQLATARGAQRALLLQELGQLAATGVTGQEINVDALSEQIANADVVTFAGEQYTVEEMLRDDFISDSITRYFIEGKDSTFSKELAAQNPELISWMESNKDSLEVMADQMASKQSELMEVQEEKRELASGMVGEESYLPEGVSFNDKVMTSILGDDWSQFTAEVPDVSQTGVFQYIKDAKASTGAAMSEEEIGEFVGLLNTTPKEKLQYFADLNHEQTGEIQAAFETSKTLDKDRVWFGDILGGEDLEGLVTDEGLQEDVAKVEPVLDELDKNESPLKEDEDFKELVRSGDVNADNIAGLVEDPTVFNEFKQYKGWLKEVENMSGKTGMDMVDAVIDTVFGYDVNPADIEAEYANLKDLVKFNPEATEAKARMSKLQDLLGSDGKFTDEDATSMYERLKSDLNADDMTDFSSAMAGGDVEMDTLKEAWGDLDKEAVISAGEIALSQKIKDLTAGGKRTIKESDLVAMWGADPDTGDPATLDKMLDNINMWKRWLPGKFRGTAGRANLIQAAKDASYHAGSKQADADFLQLGVGATDGKFDLYYSAGIKAAKTDFATLAKGKFPYSEETYNKITKLRDGFKKKISELEGEIRRFKPKTRQDMLKLENMKGQLKKAKGKAYNLWKGWKAAKDYYNLKNGKGVGSLSKNSQKSLLGGYTYSQVMSKLAGNKGAGYYKIIFDSRPPDQIAKAFKQLQDAGIV